MNTVNPISDPKIGGYIATIIGTIFIISIICADQFNFNDGFNSIKKSFDIIKPMQSVQVEAFGNEEGFYNNKPRYANSAQGTAQYAKPNPAGNAGTGQPVNLNSSGDQLLSYQIYQQAVNAATPTRVQLDSISGQSQEQTGGGAISTGGGVSSKTAPYDILNGNLYDSEFQAVNMGNNRAQKISACAQNAPTFVATSLLPKPNIPGQESWDINAPSNILANQNFLSATQQVGIDTVLGSTRNSSYDIRNNIPNPINVVSPWLNTDITPDLERRPLDCFVPQTGIYGCSTSGGTNMNGTFVGK